MLKRKIKLFITVTFLGGLLAVTGCAPATPGYDVPYTDATFTVMAEDIEQVVCSVEDQTVMTEQNVEDFRELSSRVNLYEGDKKKEASQAATMLSSLADDWEVSLGADLGPENAEELTALCESVSKL